MKQNSEGAEIEPPTVNPAPSIPTGPAERGEFSMLRSLSDLPFE
jgi:hypothetical protein